MVPYRLAISLNGVNDGTRTHDNQCHKLALYQLNYVHHMERVVGIEPTFPAWKAGVLPIYDTRMFLTVLIIINSNNTVKTFYITSVRLFCNIFLKTSPAFLLIVASLHISNQVSISSLVFFLNSSSLLDI